MKVLIVSRIEVGLEKIDLELNMTLEFHTQENVFWGSSAGLSIKIRV